MKSIIYKNPVISAILLNLFSLFLCLYIYIHSFFGFILTIMPLNGFLNGKIIVNGTDMNNKKKILIIVSLLIMIGIILFSIYNMILNKFIN
ncbi:hypothetical protein KPL39_15205 [Clostridium gasigenes]|uniref:hypothetical protein n=1 Tax=Clostridium gasigenes TaxID=94869 RepID=UPI001C0B9BD0|nr:hypothetical protein [Clostridium gasigenes]MBU3137611.1 hypothetical protein [Clostridium gasigenes]